MPFCQYVVAKFTLVPCFINLTGKRDKVCHNQHIKDYTQVTSLSILKLFHILNLKLPFLIFLNIMPLKKVEEVLQQSADTQSDLRHRCR